MEGSESPIATPGKLLGSTKDLIAGSGTYTRENYIFASVLGTKLLLACDSLDEEVKQQAPKLLTAFFFSPAGFTHHPTKQQTLVERRIETRGKTHGCGSERW